MSSPTVLVERRQAVAVVTLNRPDAANTFNLEMGRALFDVASALELDVSVRAVVITGAGSTFCLGGDLHGMVKSGADIAGYLRDLTAALHAALICFMRMRAPVIAAVNGVAAGAGIGLVAISDLVIAAERAKFTSAYTGVALTPDAGTSHMLPRVIGLRRAAEMILTNRVLLAAEALDWGLVNRVVPDGELIDTAISLAEKMATGPLGALAEAKRLLSPAIGELERHLALERETIATTAATAEGREGVRAFLEKRKAIYP